MYLQGETEYFATSYCMRILLYLYRHAVKVYYNVHFGQSEHKWKNVFVCPHTIGKKILQSISL
jgi:hypothetical protein